MKILFLHPNQPSQFKNSAIALAKDPANTVLFLTRKNLDVGLPDVQLVPFYEVSDDAKSDIFTRKVLDGSRRATAVANECMKLKQQGFIPDVIVAHSGWGDGAYIHTVFPNVPQLHYMEFFFRDKGADLGFDPRLPAGPNIVASRSMDNTIHMHNFYNASWCVTPTFWQRSVHPEYMQDKISVLHEGVDVEVCQPKQWPKITLPNGVELEPDKDEIIVHVQRQFDRYRGFETFINGIDIICQQRPNAHVIVIGKEGESYSQSKPGYFKDLIARASFDRSRVHFVGHQPYPVYIQILQAASVNVYLTYPFVLSWSFMEAMAVGAPTVCSNTSPVAEVVNDEEHCLMFDFFSPEQLAAGVNRMLDDRDLAKQLGSAARQKIVTEYNAAELTPKMVALIKDVAAQQKLPASAVDIEQWNKQLGRFDLNWQKQIPLYPYSSQQKVTNE